MTRRFILADGKNPLNIRWLVAFSDAKSDELDRFSTSEERLPSWGGACSRRWCLGQLQFRIRQLRLIL
jgi:hypothetical protein